MRKTIPSIVAAVLMSLLCVQQWCVAQQGQMSADARFLAAYQVLVKADDARNMSKHVDAADLYKKALESYSELAARYPEWKPRVVQFRIAYCDGQLGSVLKKAGITMADLAQPKATTISKEPVKSGRHDETKKIAKDLLVKGKTAEARELLMEAMNIDPDDSSIRLLMGVTQCQAGQYQDAIYVLKQLIDESPENARARAVLGTAYFGLGQNDRAEAETSLALKLKSDLHEAHYNMVQILLAGDSPNIKRAKLHYAKALELGAKPDKSLEKRLNNLN